MPTIRIRTKKQFRACRLQRLATNNLRRVKGIDQARVGGPKVVATVFDSARVSAKGGGASPREPLPHTPQRPTSGHSSANGVLRGSSSHERLYGPAPSRIPRLPVFGDEEDPFGTQSLWAAPTQRGGAYRHLGDSHSAKGTPYTMGISLL